MLLSPVSVDHFPFPGPCPYLLFALLSVAQAVQSMYNVIIQTLETRKCKSTTNMWSALYTDTVYPSTLWHGLLPDMGKLYTDTTLGKRGVKVWEKGC